MAKILETEIKEIVVEISNDEHYAYKDCYTGKLNIYKMRHILDDKLDLDVNVIKCKLITSSPESFTYLIKYMNKKD